MKTTPEDKAENRRHLGNLLMREAEEKLRDALALLTQAKAHYEKAGDLGGGYGMVGDAGHYRHAVAELLSHNDEGVEGFSSLVRSLK